MSMKSPGNPSPKQTPLSEMNDDDANDVLIMSLRLKSGRFESSIQIPLKSSEAAKRQFMERWLALMEAGLKC